MCNKFFVVFLVVFVVAVSSLTDQDQFEEFKKKFDKQYNSPEEEQTRFKNFQTTLRHVEENNRKFAAGEVTHTEGINQFSDLSQEEWANRNHGLKAH